MGNRERRSRSRNRNSPKLGLGDMIESALSSVGITPESVKDWLGSCGGCKKRKAAFNKLGEWANRLISGKISPEEAAKELDEQIKKG